MRLADQVYELGGRLTLLPPGERPPEDLLDYMQLQRNAAKSAWILRGTGEPFWIMNPDDWKVAARFLELAGIDRGDRSPRILGLPVLPAPTAVEPPYLAFRAASPAASSSAEGPAASESASP